MAQFQHRRLLARLRRVSAGVAWPVSQTAAPGKKWVTAHSFWDALIDISYESAIPDGSAKLNKDVKDTDCCTRVGVG